MSDIAQWTERMEMARTIGTLEGQLAVLRTQLEHADMRARVASEAHVQAILQLGEARRELADLRRWRDETEAMLDHADRDQAWERIEGVPF